MRMDERESETQKYILNHALWFDTSQATLSKHQSLIFTDQRLTCSNPVEARFYKSKFDYIPCHKCGAELDADGIEKFHLMKRDYLTVLPCCTGVCAVGPTKGWITKGKSKRNIRAGKRKAICMNINLTTFQPRPIGNTVESLQDWLADSIPAWNQLLSLLKMKRQIKKHKRGVWL